MKIYRMCLVIGIVILFFAASIDARVVTNVNCDKEKVNSMILNKESHGGQIIRSWSDNFDSYTTGQFLDGGSDDGGWIGWDDNTAAGAFVVDDNYLSEPHSVEIVGATDLVHEFSDYTSGQWAFIAWQYVPTDFSGESYFILLSDYADVDPGTNSKWAIQIRFDSTGIVESEFDSVTLPLITGQWVPLYTEINLDTDLFKFYYNGDLLIQKAWTAGPNNDNTGYLVIDAVDLFANSASVVYYDDLSLDIPQSLSCDAYGPYFGNIMEDVEFDGTATGGIPPYEYLWDFGDGNTSDDPHPTHNYANAGNYTVTLTVTDGQEDTADDTTWALINGPPNAPTILGPNGGKPGEEYDFTFNAVDPEGYDVKFIIDWGDDETDTTAFTGSGEDIVASHTWDEKGVYTITAYAEDSEGATGPSATKDVNIPRTRAINNPFINWLQSHPNIFPIIQRLLNRIGIL